MPCDAMQSGLRYDRAVCPVSAPGEPAVASVGRIQATYMHQGVSLELVLALLCFRAAGRRLRVLQASWAHRVAQSTGNGTWRVATVLPR